MIGLPYKKGFRQSQGYSKAHTGIDLVGEDKYIIAVADGVVDYSGWENPNNKKQGFGLYVRVKGDDGLYYYYGHLNWIFETLIVGTRVRKGGLIGLEGSTGKSTGSHLHLEIRKKPGKIKDIEDSINVETLLKESLKAHNNIDVVHTLAKNDILENEEYWKEKIKEVPYLDTLFVNMATYINEHL
jgi:murein DD-endopeptidase MepM/ murein hydrolase activator NlpD